MTAPARKSPLPDPPPKPPRVPKNNQNPVEKKSASRSRRDTRHLVLAMDQEGHSKAEIATTLGITPQAISSALIRAGAGTGRKGATRRVSVFIPRRYFRILKLLADEQKTSPSAALAQVVKAALPDMPTARKAVRRKAA